MLYLLLLLVFLEMILLVIIFYSYMKQNKPIVRLNKYFEWESHHQQKRQKRVIETNFKEAFHVLGKQMMKLFILKRYRERMDKSLVRGDIPLRAEEMLFIIFLSVFFTFSMSVAFTRRIGVSIIMGVIVLLLFRVVIKNKEQKRLMKINEQLSDAIDMMSGSLRAGYSFTQAMENTGKEMPLPISKEFLKVIKEIELGLPVEKGLENLLDRVPSEDLELLITAVMIQRQIGGNLAEILDNISGTIRQRINLKGEVKTLTAQGRISGWIIGLLPLIFMLIMFLLNPSYIKILFTDRFGLAMLGMGVIGEVIGIALIKKIINIQY